MENYELNALLYAERYGIVTYHVENDVMTYHEHFPQDGTYKVIVNLATMKESRTKITMVGVKHLNLF